MRSYPPSTLMFRYLRDFFRGSDDYLCAVRTSQFVFRLAQWQCPKSGGGRQLTIFYVYMMFSDEKRTSRLCINEG